jgi:Protein of unknown function (DUF3060)
MDPKDDPEARIRELERPLADAARASELGTDQRTGPAGPPPTQPWTYGNNFPPPPPEPPSAWPGQQPYPAPPPPRPSTGTAAMFILLGVLTMVLVAGGIGAFLVLGRTDTDNTDTLSEDQSTTIRQTTISDAPMPEPTPEPVGPQQIPAGQTVIVSGIGENRTIECQDNTVIVSGMQNQLEITGHCAAVTVSGIENIVTVESVGTIGVSGFDNRVTFHNGEPEVSNSGQSNVVEQG